MADTKAKAPEAVKESAVKSMLVPIIVLVAICVICSALLAYLNSMTAPIIEENTKAATLASYLSVMPEGTKAEDLTDMENLTTEGVEGAVKAADGTVAVKASANGYSGKAVTVYAAFAADGTVSNLSVDASTQTTGIGSKTGEESFSQGFVGWNTSEQVSAGQPVDAIAGATISSNAVIKALNEAIDCYNNEIAGVA